MSEGRVDALFLRKIYPLQVSVYQTEIVHILQAARNVSQLTNTSMRLLRGQAATYKLRAVCVGIPLNESVDISVLHPLGYHRKPVITDGNSKQRQDVRMPEVLPSDPLSAESLPRSYRDRRDSPASRLTLRIRSNSLVMYTRTALMATRRPSYVPRNTSAKPPYSTSTEPLEQSGMFMDVGIMRCRLHVLQSLLSNFRRSRSGIVRSCRRCISCQPLAEIQGGMQRDPPCPFHQYASRFLAPNLAGIGKTR